MKEQGYGCMGLSAFYSSAKTTSPEQARAVVLHALDSGVTIFNTATFYGPLNEEGFGANLRLLKYCFEGIERSNYQLMVKIGMDTRYLLICFCRHPHLQLFLSDVLWKRLGRRGSCEATLKV
jgi:aryl-alcohol dehydrogenase-like predicted oxidoreductase